MGTTLRAMKRVQQIKTKREERFYKERMAASREVQKVQDRKELKESIDLINVPAEVKEAVKQKMTIKERAAEAAAPKAMEMEGFGDDSD